MTADERASYEAMREERDQCKATAREQIERIRLHIEEVVLARRERDERHTKQLAAEATVARLVEALRTYGYHQHRCAVRRSGMKWPDCDCGFGAALSASPTGEKDK